MSRLIFLTIVAVLASQCRAAPADISPNADWPLIDQLLDELQLEVQNAMLRIFNHANDENPTIGAAIAQQLMSAAGEGVALLDEVRQLVAEQTLTVEIAEEDFARLRLIFRDLEINIDEFVRQLSNSTQNKIHSDFNQFYGHIHGVENAIYDAINWEPTEPPTTMLPESVVLFE